MRRWRQWAGLVVLGGLMGCTVGPVYKRPAVALPEKRSAQPASGVTVQATEVVQWWSTFGDPVLNSLIERAVSANFDLRIATARVREARALRGVTAAGSWPAVDVAGSYLRSRRSENLRAGGFSQRARCATLPLRVRRSARAERTDSRSESDCLI